MALTIVGAGFGRTGTHSLKLALEQLGFGPCHHMYEVIENPEQLPYWQAAARGELPDWDEVFANYGSCVDWPSARYWRELAAHYSDAKVLLSVRPEENWLKSIHGTIYPVIRDRADNEPGFYRDLMEMTYAIIEQQTFGDQLGDPGHAIEVYRAHNAEVQATIAPDRLLTFDVTEGWEPLCAFLGAPVPDIPFPHTNQSQDFQASADELAGKS